MDVGSIPTTSTMIEFFLDLPFPQEMPRLWKDWLICLYCLPQVGLWGARTEAKARQSRTA